MTEPRVEINGMPASVPDLAFAAQVNYGHFTSMQVRGRGVRGLDLHLQRLQRSTQALFGTELDSDRVRSWLRQLVDDTPLSVRITVFARTFDRSQPERTVPVDVMIAASAARVPASTALRVKSAVHVRYLPQVKHVGTFSLFHLVRSARLAGWDDVLLADPYGRIAEGSTWNIGLWDGERVVWPNAPALAGVTEQLVEYGLRAHGIDCQRRPIDLGQMHEWRCAFASNSGAPVRLIACVDENRFADDRDFAALLKTCYEAQPLQPI
ncbi:MAG: aminotransferase class IV [Dokdonella sp.]